MMLQPSTSRSKLLPPTRFFPDPTIRTQRTQSQSSIRTQETLFPMASGNRQYAVAQSSIPSPSGLKLPSTSSTTLTKKPVVIPAAPVSSRQDHQQRPVAVSVKQSAEKDPRPVPTLERRGSYTISSGPTSGVSPVVISSGPSSPDDNQDDLVAAVSSIGRPGSDVLNTTLTLKGQSLSPYRLAELRETEFRQHLNRAVCIGGEKRGVLRYFGPLHMVDGLFCGIELDEAVGQHDGKIDGRRYFRAGYNRGIFAPMEKVELIGKEPVRTPVMTRPSETAAAELIIPADAEYLTDVEPHLMCHSLLGQSAGATGGDSFDLSESLMFLKGSRFPGMDISMTPSQLAAQFRGEPEEEVEDNEEEDEVEEEEEGEEMLQPEDLEAAYLEAQGHLEEEEDNDYMDEESATPVFEQPPEQPDFEMGMELRPPLTSSTPMTGVRVHAEKTAGNLNSTMTFNAARPSSKRGDTLPQAERAPAAKERPISTISADTGYQGDTEYETQSGRSASPREMDVTFGRQQQPSRGNALDGAGQQKLEKQQAAQQQMATVDNDDAGLMNGSLESLSCETTIRDSRGRVVKVLKETKRVPKARLHDLNASDAVQSLLQLTDVGSSSNGGTQSASSTAPPSPSKTKRTKSESIGRESQRKPAKSQKVAEAGNKENSHRDDNSRPPSGVGGGSPARRRPEKPEKPAEEPVKKIVKAPPKPSKHSEIMAKLQESMAQDKQKPKKEVRSKFMTALTTATPARSDDHPQQLLSTRPSLLPTPRSRASSTASSLVNGGNHNGHSSAGSSDADCAPASATKKITSPADEKQTPAGEHAPADPFKVPHSPLGKGAAAAKKVAVAATGLSKNAVNNGAIDTGKKKSTLAVKKTPATAIGQTRDAAGRPGSSAGRAANGIPSTSSAVASPTSATPRQQGTQRKLPTASANDVRLKELEVQAEQLKLAKERLCNSAKGFEALSILIRYYVEKVIPNFHSNLSKTKAELGAMKLRTEELTKANETLQVEKRQMSEAQAKALEELCREYEEKVKKLEADLRSNYEQKMNELTSRHGQELAKVHDENARERERLNENFERQRKAEIERFEAKVVSLQEQHGRDVADLKVVHQNMADDLLRRFEEEKTAMGYKMDELHKQCDRYKLEARQLEETLMKDTEKKMSAVSERFNTYQHEIDSLRSVMEMKNQEVHELRSKCSHAEKELEELPKCRTKIALLEQKNAELKEALDLKKKAEKLFYQQHSELLQSCERERERSQRLSMDKEQLEFKLQKLIMSQSAYETPMGRMSSDESEADGAAHRSRTAPRGGASAAAVLKDKPMSQSLIQIYAESSPWSPRSTARTGHHDSKDLPVTVYMAAQDGEVAHVLQFDGEVESVPGKIKDGRSSDNGKATAHSSSDSLSSPQTPPRGAKSVDKMSSPKRRISPLRRRNISMSGGVAPMPATPEHPGDLDSAGDRMTAEPLPDCPKSPGRRAGFYDGHDPQDPAPPYSAIESSTAGKTGCITSVVGWTDSGVFTTSCTSDTQELMPFGGVADHESAAVVTSSAQSASSAGETEKRPASIDTVAPGHCPAVVNGCSKIPKKNGAV